MKLFHLISLLALTVNFSGKPAPDRPQALAGAQAGASKQVVYSEGDNIIPWTPERRLAWDDFLCEPKKEGDAVASTSTSLGLSYKVRDNQLTFHITCDFSKEKSWGALRTDYILAHEQGHFDITEIHARKLYEALYNYQLDPVTFKADIAAIYNQIVKEKEDMQEAYDGQTDHSRRKGLQTEWLGKIDTLLDATEMFSTYP
jgi:hypothetical protein